MFALDVLHVLNRAHSNFRGVFFDDFRALLGENDDAIFVRRMGKYIRLMQSMYMFVRVERPVGSLRFVLAYLKCDRVFSFAPRFERMRVRLNRVLPMVLMDVEYGENKALRLACVGETDYERALAMHSDTRIHGELLTPLSAAICAKDEDAAKALLDGWDDPNDGGEYTALCIATKYGCRQPLFDRILAMTHNVNTVINRGLTALMLATVHNHLDLVIALMNHPWIDVNAQGDYNLTALHLAVYDNRLAILAQLLSGDSIDSSLKAYNRTPLKLAIDHGHDECVKILREHGAPEE